MRGPAELRASHEVLEFVRDKPDLSLQVMQLRDAGMSWLRVQEVLKSSPGESRARSAKHVVSLAATVTPPPVRG